MSIPEDMYYEEEVETAEEPDPPGITNEESNDPVLSTFHQFLHKARHMKICHTTRVIDLPSRAINVHFSRDNNKYGRLISDNAADTGSLTPKYCHIIQTSQQPVMVNGCHTTMTKSYFL